jgi:hypothetical protein
MKLENLIQKYVPKGIRHVAVTGLLLTSIAATTLAACTMPPSPTPYTPTPTSPAPTATYTVKPEESPTPTITLSPTPAPLPTATFTPTLPPPTVVIPSPTSMATPTPPPLDHLILRYDITVAKPLNTAQTAHLKIKVEQCTRPTLIFIVGWYYNSNDKRNFTAQVIPNINNMVAYDSPGNNLSIKLINSNELLKGLGWPGSAAWKLDMRGNSTATIEFDELVTKNYNALDMFPINQSIGQISVNFNFPDGWLPVTVWTPVNNFEFYVPATRKGVLGNFSVADIAARPQNQTVWTTVINGTKFLFYAEPWSPENMNYTLTVWSYLKSVYGGYPYDHYIFLGGGLHYLRQTSGWVASTNQGWASNHLGLDSPLTYMISSYACEKFGKYVASGFHELSHSWNVDQFRWRDSGGEWFHDGIANYFEAVGPRDAFGLDQLYRAWLYQAWKSYQEKNGTQYDIPLIKLGNVANNPDLDLTLMKYFKGALFYYMLDKELQKAGNNFYDFTAYLYENFPPDSNPGTIDEFIESAELFAKKDLSNFFTAYFFGNEDYPLQELDAYQTDYKKVFGSHTCKSIR